MQSEFQKSPDSECQLSTGTVIHLLRTWTERTRSRTLLARLLADRVSNLVALAMLFLAGWLLARYSGGRGVLTGVIMTLVGVALILAIIALGG